MACPVAVAGIRAQQRIWRLGWLTPWTPPVVGRPHADLEAFKSALAELGYIEGRDYLIDARFANTDNSRLPALAKELIADDVDIIVTIGTSSRGGNLKFRTISISPSSRNMRSAGLMKCGWLTPSHSAS
jgi:hypothetical protein